MNADLIATSLAEHWDADIVPQLRDYIRIPAKSPHFEPDWVAAGHLERVVQLAFAWVMRQGVRGMRAEIVRLSGRTPLLYIDIAGNGPGTVMLYGHLDKQPEMIGWDPASGPWEPRLDADGKLYGRGGADDGYAVFASLAAIAALQRQDIPHSRCVAVIETCEESGSYDLPAYLDTLAPRMGNVDLVIGLDSGCGDYERLWTTTSLRGLAGGVLTVQVLTEGVHSGDASGVVPSSFRIARKLLDRLEDSGTGHILPAVFHGAIPDERVDQAGAAAAIMGDLALRKYPFATSTQPMVDDSVEGLLNRTWRPALSVTGAEGLPAVGSAGNVLRPSTSLKLSLRLPPTVDAETATRELTALLQHDPPYNARVEFKAESAATGWNAPPTAPWLAQALEQASSQFFKRPAAAMGEGGTIPFMAMLGRHFPDAQFMIAGVLGPHSNAHGPNEFLHVPYAKKLNACVASVIAAHAARG
jgi:acetylornithine deacetylase/succinyl-diaminopimelate desuccinylase-like protein